jgi:hypothetical protein
MANRSYVYSADTAPKKGKAPKPIRSLSEFNWGIPLAHKILASGSPVRGPSIIWDQAIGISADWSVGTSRLLGLFDALSKEKKVAKPKDLAVAIAETKKTFASKKFKGKLILLEAGEIFDMEGGSLEKRCDALITEIGKVAKEVDAAIAGKGKLLSKLAKTWEEDLGVEWSDVLYFDFGD